MNVDVPWLDEDSSTEHRAQSKQKHTIFLIESGTIVGIYLTDTK